MKKPYPNDRSITQFDSGWSFCINNFINIKNPSSVIACCILVESVENDFTSPSTFSPFNTVNKLSISWLDNCVENACFYWLVDSLY